MSWIFGFTNMDLPNAILVLFWVWVAVSIIDMLLTCLVWGMRWLRYYALMRGMGRSISWRRNRFMRIERTDRKKSA